jgi:DNA-directed RNA polymerase subunit RPC12/RpoP
MTIQLTTYKCKECTRIFSTTNHKLSGEEFKCTYCGHVHIAKDGDGYGCIDKDWFNKIFNSGE